jgi:plastocyanin
MRPLTLLAVLFALSLSLSAATIQVRVTGAGAAAIPDAVVYAVPPAPLPLAKRTAVMDQINRTFVPHVLPVQAGTWVEFPNSDQVRHQVFSVSPARRFSTPLYVGKPARPIQFPTAGVVALGCTVHEQMSAYVVIVDTPYFATTAKDGQAELRDVPSGRYSLRVWYPGMRTEPAPQSITVGAEDFSLTVAAAGH